MACGLCRWKKNTRIYRDRAAYVIRDCPVCGGKLIFFKEHEPQDGQREMAESLATAQFGKGMEIVEKGCFSTTHPHFHFERKPVRKSTHVPAPPVEEPDEEEDTVFTPEFDVEE